MMKKVYNFFLLLSFMLATSAHAQLIFSENFDYPVGNLEGRNGGLGFSTAWTKNGTNVAASLGADNKATILAGSIAANGRGNRAQLCLDSGKTVRLDRTMPVNLNGAKGTTYWFGFWFRSTTDTSSATTGGIGAQLCFMAPPYNTDAWAQRLQFGKQATGVAATNNNLSLFSRAAGCSATGGGTGGVNWGSGLSAKTTKYILAKIIKGDSTDATGNVFDVVRIWFLDAMPTTEASLAANGNTPIGRVATRVLRADNNSFCVQDGITGIRLRVEGGGTTAYCAEFDDMRLTRSFASLLATSTNEVAADYFDAKIAPNPAIEKATLTLNVKKAGRLDVGIYDLAGKRVSTVSQAQMTEGVQNVDINTSNLAGGLYFVKTSIEGATSMQKLMVVK
jgi:Secretion system C-terminal sorting domain